MHHTFSGLVFISSVSTADYRPFLASFEQAVLEQLTLINYFISLHAAVPSYKNLEKSHSFIFSKNWKTTPWAYFKPAKKI